MPTGAGKPHQPTTTPAQTPASARVDPIDRSNYAGDHQQHHARDEDAVLRRVEEDGRDVERGREVVRVEERHRADEERRSGRAASARATRRASPGSRARQDGTRALRRLDRAALSRSPVSSTRPPALMPPAPPRPSEV